jgi:selenophosphate synthase
MVEGPNPVNYLFVKSEDCIYAKGSMHGIQVTISCTGNGLLKIVLEMAQVYQVLGLFSSHPVRTVILLQFHRNRKGGNFI